MNKSLRQNNVLEWSVGGSSWKAYNAYSRNVQRYNIDGDILTMFSCQSQIERR